MFSKQKYDRPYDCTWPLSAAALVVARRSRSVSQRSVLCRTVQLGGLPLPSPRTIVIPGQHLLPMHAFGHVPVDLPAGVASLVEANRLLCSGQTVDNPRKYLAPLPEQPTIQQFALLRLGSRLRKQEKKRSETWCQLDEVTKESGQHLPQEL